MRVSLKSLVDFLWAAFSAILIASAALVTTVRLMLPEVSSQRDAIAEWISDTVGRPAVVGDIEASWSGWSPRITVDDIAFLDNDQKTELVRFERASINIAPLGSLLSASLKPKSLVVSGVALTLLRDDQGRFSVAGMPPPKSPILRWLVRQDNFAVTEADLTVIDDQAGKSFALEDVAVTIHGDDQARRITAHLNLPDAIGRRIVLEMNASGDPLSAGWSGDIAFRIDALRGDYLAGQGNWRAVEAMDTTLDVRGWTQWQQARLEAARFDVAASAAAPGAPPAAQLSGGLARLPHGWLLNLFDVTFADAAPGTGSGRLTLAYNKLRGEKRSVAWRGESLDAGPLLGLLASLDVLNDDLRAQLSELAPSASVTHTEGAWLAPDEQAPTWFATADVRRLATNQGTAIPGLSGADLRIRAHRDGGRIFFDRSSFKLNHDQRLVDTLDISDLDGTLAWRRSTDGLDLGTQRLAGDVDGIKFRLRGRLIDATSSERYLDMRVAIPEARGEHLHHLIPRDALPPRGERWSRHIIHDGQISNGRVAFRGLLRDFPFRASEGVFRVGFDVSEATLEYSQRWPIAGAVTGRVNMHGIRSSMHIEHADVLGATIDNAEIVMPDTFVRQRWLRMSGLARGPAVSATNIVMASPLRNGKAARLAEIDIGGDIEVVLDMEIGLFPNGPREVLGQARFAGNRVDAPRLKVLLDEVSGTVSFTRTDWYGENLNATFAGTPVGLIVNGGLDDPNYDSEFRMTGTPDAPLVVDMLERYAPPVHAWLDRHASLDALRGRIPWKVVLTIPTHQAAGPQLPRRLTLESSLQGVDIDLPWPFGKSATERKPLRVEIAVLDGVATQTRIDFGDTLDAEINARPAPDGPALIERVEVLFGNPDPEFTGAPGINLSGYIQRLPLGDWNRFSRRSSARGDSRLDELPFNFDLQISELAFLGQQFSDMRLSGQREESRWLISANGDQARGTIAVPRNSAPGSIDLKFEHLVLARNPGQDTDAPAATLDPRQIPALNLEARHFVYNDIDLGQTAIRTARADAGLTLESLRFSGADFAIDASGQWTLAGAAHNSDFLIKVSADELGALLDRFGYDVANIDGGETTMSIAAHWPGTPVEFSLAGMSGDFELHVGEGRFLDIEPGGGRLFGLLSIQSLPRRLSLDFDDLFRKGFAFDRIDGVFELDAGNAYTNSLLMSGPSASIDISGRTGLTEQDYDQRVVVTPALSSSLPVAGALFGPIGVGAGAVVFLGQKMFKSIPRQIDRILRREYAVTGSWTNPSVDRI